MHRIGQKPAKYTVCARVLFTPAEFPKGPKRGTRALHETWRELPGFAFVLCASGRVPERTFSRGSPGHG
ncbi:hypothetical protein BRAS3843_380040 [Bradyrhizobium sp. STM 3843]|nr:hypothetical protein BRAS3843_380040 [Bradyrhizobium sp. STM 3843]